MTQSNTPSNPEPSFWSVVVNTIVGFAIASVIVWMLEGCSTHKEIISTSVDSVSCSHVEKTNVWANVCKADTFTRDRLVTIVLNEKGDTVKQKETVYVRDKSNHIADVGKTILTQDSVSNKSNSNKSVSNTTTTPVSAWQQFMLKTYWCLVGVLCLVLLVIIYKVKKH